MINFSTLREKKEKGMPPGEHVFMQKVAGHDLMIHKEKGQYVAYIDMEKFDEFRSVADAKNAMKQFIKMVGGKKR